jgi:chromosome segregation ATPase
MSEPEQSNYNLFYIKRQEQLLFEQIKKGIEYEVRLTMLIGSYEEAKKNLEQQNEINQQAMRSIEDLTIKNKNLQSENEKIAAKVPGLENAIHENNKLQVTLAAERDNLTFRLGDLQKEIKRQQDEMQNLFNENTELKAALEIVNQKKIINKKKPVETPTAVLLEDNVF